MHATLTRPNLALARVGGTMGDEESVDALAAIGAELEAERRRLGLDKDDLAYRAGKMSRTTLNRVLAGERTSPPTVDRVRRALHEFDVETRRREGEGVGNITAIRPGEDIVTFRLKGNFGVDVTLQGPVGNLEELEETVRGLIREMRENDER